MTSSPGSSSASRDGGDGLRGARGDQDLAVRVEGQAVPALLVRRRSAVRSSGTPGPGGYWLPRPVAQGPDRRLPYGLGAVGVGEALAEVDGPGPQGEGGHLGEDRRPELGEAAVEERARAGGHDGHPAGNLWSCSSVLWRPDGAGHPLSTRDHGGPREKGRWGMDIAIGVGIVVAVVLVVVASPAARRRRKAGGAAGAAVGGLGGRRQAGGRGGSDRAGRRAGSGGASGGGGHHGGHHGGGHHGGHSCGRRSLVVRRRPLVLRRGGGCGSS